MMMSADKAATDMVLRRKAADVPYHVSALHFFLVAVASPMAAVLWEFYWIKDFYSDPSLEGLHEVHASFRRLDGTKCLINATTSGNEIYATPPESTWAVIFTTTCIAFSMGCWALMMHEAFRRDPILRKYVYDRKRLTQPNRAPPPLMLSRSLWRGHDDQSEAQNYMKWNLGVFWKAPPALFEVFFMTMDESYIQYSQAANYAMEERIRRGYYSCCQAGCYHNNCCNTVHPRHFSTALSAADDGDEYIDEDGYVYYPTFNHYYSFVHECENSYESMRFRTSFGCAAQNDPSRSSSGSCGMKSVRFSSSMGALAQSGSERFSRSSMNVGGKKWNMSIRDLYPENFAPILHDVMESATVSLDTSNSSSSENEVNINTNERSMSEEGDTGRSNSIAEPSNFPSEESSSSERVLPPCCTNMERSQSYENSRKKNDISIDQTLQVAGNDPDTGILLVENNQTVKPFPYPNRLSNFFLPPGFHKWSDAREFFREFFFVPQCSKYINKAKHVCFGSDIPPMPSMEQERKHEKILILCSAEEELLRCAGLDTYLLIRIARFGFDACFYPWCFACVTVFPVYLLSNPVSATVQKELPQNDQMVSSVSVLINQFFSLTINRIEPGSNKMIWILLFSFILYLFILRRLWLEWEIIIRLRHRFLANGDENFHPNPAYLQKFRNTCMVECIPKALRSDRNIRELFERLFPGQIKSAEMLIDTMKLESILKKRRDLIEKYETVMAKYQYECWRYQKQKRYKLFSYWEESEPVEPKIRTGQMCCFSKKENALSYYEDLIEKCNDAADKEYERVVTLRLNWRNNCCVSTLISDVRQTISSNGLYSIFLPGAIREVLGLEIPDFFCGTAMVEFKSITTKQSAVQCNLSGASHWMVTQDAPDPRDILWSNITVDRKMLERRKTMVEFIFGIGILTWGAFVTFVSNVALTSIRLKHVDDQSSALAHILKGYVPALIILTILMWLPSLILFFAIHVIKFKSLSQCDEFVIKWSTAFRYANIFFIIFSFSLIQAFHCFKDDPENFVERVSEGVLRQSSFLLKLIILATGQETMMQLMQWRSLIKHAIYRPLVNFNSKSRRFLDWLNEAPLLEKSFIFGFFAPTLSDGMMIGILYSYMAPVILGICSIFFWIATKVHTHNALFIYCQPFEGGGKIFYYWNRIIFRSMYSSIFVFTGILLLKQFMKMALCFFIISYYSVLISISMLLITVVVDKSIQDLFVVHSLYLPLTIAQIHDEEEVALLEKSSLEKDEAVNFMYRHPMLNQFNWDTRPVQWV